MRFGPKCKDGCLPVFSVATEKEARSLLVAACGTNMDGEFVAKELVMDQTLENLRAFSDRLVKMWKFLQTARRRNARAAQKG